MNENHTTQSLSETAELDLIAVIWRMLRQWKCVLIVALIFGLLASVALHMRSAGNTKVDSSTNGVSEIEETEKQMVETLLLEEDQLNDVLTYLDNSTLMQSDFHAIRQLALQYYIEPDGDLPTRERSLLRRAYVNAARSDEMYEALQKAGAIDDSMAYDIIQVGYEAESEYVLDDAADTSRSDIYTISIVLNEEMDPEKIETVVTNFLNDQTKSNADRFGAHHLEKLNSNISTTADYDTSAHRYALIQQVYNLRSQIKLLKDALSDQQMTYYESMKGDFGAEHTLGKGPVRENAAQTGAAGSWFSKKYFAVGFALGIVLYAIFLVLYMVRSKRIVSPAVVEAAGYRVFGALYQPGVKSGLLESRLFYRLLHRGKLDLQSRLERVSDAVAATAEHRSIEALTIMPLGDAKREDGVLKQLCERLIQAGVKAEITPLYEDGHDGGSDQAFLHQKPIVPVVLGERTTTDMVDAIAGRCAHYDVELLGVVYAG